MVLRRHTGGKATKHTEGTTKHAKGATKHTEETTKCAEDATKYAARRFSINGASWHMSGIALLVGQLRLTGFVDIPFTRESFSKASS